MPTTRSRLSRPSRQKSLQSIPKQRRRPDVLAGAPLHRVWRIHARIVRGERVTAITLAADLEVTPLTIKRDIDMMRDRLGLPLAWDAARHTYHYTRPCETLPMLRLDVREALALALAGRLVDRANGSAFGSLLAALLRKIAPVFGGAVSFAVASVEGALSRAGSVEDVAADHLFAVLEAILDRRELRLAYRKARSADTEERVVHPLHLAEIDQRWVLLAWDTARRGLRNFLLGRIRRLGTTGRAFEPPAGFDAAKAVRGALGRFVGDAEHLVRIALDEHAAFYARESPWHPSQQLTVLVDGRTEIVLRLNHLADVRHTVLRWGAHAEVLAPPELRAEVRAELVAALGRYAAG